MIARVYDSLADLCSCSYDVLATQTSSGFATTEVHYQTMNNSW